MSCDELQFVTRQQSCGRLEVEVSDLSTERGCLSICWRLEVIRLAGIGHFYLPLRKFQIRNSYVQFVATENCATYFV